MWTRCDLHVFALKVVLAQVGKQAQVRRDVRLGVTIIDVQLAEIGKHGGEGAAEGGANGFNTTKFKVVQTKHSHRWHRLNWAFFGEFDIEILKLQFDETSERCKMSPCVLRDDALNGVKV